MTTQYTQGTTTINKDTVFPSLFNEVEKPDISKFSQQNMKTWSGLGTTVAIMFGSAILLFGESGTSDIPESLTQDTSASLELNFGEKIESGVTQEFADGPVQPFDFLSYTEEDLLDWDAAIITPPPRPSGTIRVKLKYKGRSKPFPPENFWEE
jgi:hypothetical protein